MSDEVMPLSSILDTNAAPKAPDTAPAPQSEAKPADTAAQEPAKGEDTGATPAPKAEEPKAEPVKEDPLKVLRKALKATQRELTTLRQQSQKPPPQAAIDPIADPEAYRKSIENAVSDSVFASRCADSEDDLREQLVKEHGSDDAYEEAMQTFGEMVEKDPSLAVQLRQSRKPAKFMYETVQKAALTQEMGDPRQFADKIRAQTRAEMQAEVKALVAEGIKAALGQHLPQSLADEQTQGARAQAQGDWSGPKPLENILKK